jgi:hypothetical protein
MILPTAESKNSVRFSLRFVIVGLVPMIPL